MDRLLRFRGKLIDEFAFRFERSLYCFVTSLSVSFTCFGLALAEGTESAKPNNVTSINDPRGRHIDASQQPGINTYSFRNFSSQGTHPAKVHSKIGHVKVYSGTRSLSSSSSSSSSRTAKRNSSAKTIESAIDKEALTYFNKGNQSMSKGEKEVAGFFYEKALTLISKQKNADTKLKQQIEAALSRVNQE